MVLNISYRTVINNSFSSCNISCIICTRLNRRKLRFIRSVIFAICSSIIFWLYRFRVGGESLRILVIIWRMFFMARLRWKSLISRTFIRRLLVLCRFVDCFSSLIDRRLLLAGIYDRISLHLRFEQRNIRPSPTSPTSSAPATSSWPPSSCCPSACPSFSTAEAGGD